MSFALPSRRPLVLALQLTFVAAPLLTPALMPAAQAQAAARSYSIPAGTLSRVLSQFAAEAGVLLSVDAALTEGKQSSGLQGSYGVAQGLERILAGSGLEAVPQNSGGYTLRRLPAGSGKEAALATVAVTANSAGQPGQQPKPYAGGQMARGSRVGLLGDLDMMDTPFATAAYTSQLMQDQAAKSVADVVANDPAVRVYRGYGNYAEAYTVRGLPLYADDLGFNGLYGLLPRQYVAVEMLERVEVFRGANAFLNGMASGNSGMGGSINLVPKRAGELPVTQVTGTLHGDSLFGGHVDIGRRFGPDQSVGVRVNALSRDGEGSIDREKRSLDMLAVGLDFRGDKLRLSADFGYQKSKIRQGRPNVQVAAGVAVPTAPDASRNFAPSWSYSDTEDTFAAVRGEYDLNQDWTAYAAYGVRYNKELGIYATPTVNSSNGNATLSRFEVPHEEDVSTGEAGLRGKFSTGGVSHRVSLSASRTNLVGRNAWAMSWPAQNTNIYNPADLAKPGLAFFGGDLNNPQRTADTRLSSIAVADTLGFLQDKVLLTLGARQQKALVGNYAYGSGVQSSVYDVSVTTPSAGLVVKAADNLSLYANYIEGLLQGGVAPTGTANQGQALAPFRSKQKEVGAKADFGRIAASAALFEVNQLSAATNPGTNVYEVSGEQVNRGLELSLFGEASRNLRLIGGITVMDAKLEQAASAANVGKQAIGVARFLANLSGEYDVPGVPGLAVVGRMVHTGKQYLDTANTQEVPAWTRFDAGVRYGFQAGSQAVVLRANIENLADKNYWASATGGYLTLGAPRTLTLSATVDF
ncbi:MAG: TonB-dependent siderophore receptor [Azospira sp.]|jgi:iron complex outermembrane recepter protein